MYSHGWGKGIATKLKLLEVPCIQSAVKEERVYLLWDKNANQC